MSLLVDNVIPFATNGRIDPGALRAHVLWLVAQGVPGFLPGASEMLLLDAKEKEHLVQIVADVVSGRTLVCVCWDPASGRLVKMAEHAAAHGASAVVIPPPLLHACPDDGILEWYRAVVRAVRVPVLAWHHPRFGNDLTPSLVGRLRAETGIGGWLDSSGDYFRIRRLGGAHPGLVWVDGDDEPSVATNPGMAGVVSRVANCYPELAVRCFVQGQPVGDAIALRAAALAKAGGGPAIKRLLGMGVRLPMVSVDEAAFAKLPAAGFR